MSPCAYGDPGIGLQPTERCDPYRRKREGAGLGSDAGWCCYVPVSCKLPWIDHTHLLLCASCPSLPLSLRSRVKAQVRCLSVKRWRRIGRLLADRYIRTTRSRTTNAQPSGRTAESRRAGQKRTGRVRSTNVPDSGPRYVPDYIAVLVEVRPVMEPSSWPSSPGILTAAHQEDQL